MGEASYYLNNNNILNIRVASIYLDKNILISFQKR